MSFQKLISFDLQGTISNSAFSDEFWLELLPTLYAEKHHLKLSQAKEVLEKEFKSMGKYHALFYNHRLRLDQLRTHWDFKNMISLLKNKAQLDLELIDLIQTLPAQIPKIIISATTRDFIDWELAASKKYFNQTFSAIDDFNTPGKPPVLYQQIASLMAIPNANCLHIGDCAEMDVKNAQRAGWQSYHFDHKAEKKALLLDLKNVVNKFIHSNR